MSTNNRPRGAAAGAASDTDSRRLPLATSVALHVLLVAALPVLQVHAPRSRPERQPIEVVFHAPEPERVVSAEEPPPPPPAPKPEPRIEPPPAPPPLVAANEPPPARVAPQPRPVLPEPTPLKPAVRKEPVPPPPPAPPREVHVGALARAKPAPARPEPTARTVSRVQDFAVAAAETPPPRPARSTASVQGFDAPDTPAAAPQGTRPARVVADTRFAGSTVRAPAPAPPARTTEVATAGFGTASASAATPAAGHGVGEVQLAGFGTAAASARPKQARERPDDDPDTAVEIVSKATPAYPETARELKIEGTVVLEVVFDSSGKLRVLRVVQGLGHGLDEAAVEAAEKTRFKPARREGRAVDYKATLRVVFRLA